MCIDIPASEIKFTFITTVHLRDRVWVYTQLVQEVFNGESKYEFYQTTCWESGKEPRIQNAFDRSEAMDNQRAYIEEMYAKHCSD